MDASEFTALQEALLWFYGPILTTGMFVLIAGGILTAIGAVVLDLASRLAR